MYHQAHVPGTCTHAIFFLAFKSLNYLTSSLYLELKFHFWNVLMHFASGRLVVLQQQDIIYPQLTKSKYSLRSPRYQYNNILAVDYQARVGRG